MGLKQGTREWKLRTALEAKASGFEAAASTLAGMRALSGVAELPGTPYREGQIMAYSDAALGLRELLAETEGDGS